MDLYFWAQWPNFGLEIILKDNKDFVGAEILFFWTLKE